MMWLSCMVHADSIVMTVNGRYLPRTLDSIGVRDTQNEHTREMMIAKETVMLVDEMTLFLLM